MTKEDILAFVVATIAMLVIVALLAIPLMVMFP